MEGGFQRGEKRRKRRSLAAVWLGPEGSSLLEQWKHQHDLTDAFSAVKKATEVASLSFFSLYGPLSLFLQFLFVPKPHPTPSYLLWLGLFAPFPDVFIKISSHPIITERLLPTVWEEVLLWVLSAGGRRILVAVQWVCLRLINRRDCVILIVFFFFWNLHRLRCKIRFLKPKFEWGDIKIGPSTTKKAEFSWIVKTVILSHESFSGDLPMSGRFWLYWQLCFETVLCWRVPGGCKTELQLLLVH